MDVPQAKHCMLKQPLITDSTRAVQSLSALPYISLVCMRMWRTARCTVRDGIGHRDMADWHVSLQRQELYSFLFKEQQHQHNETDMFAYLDWQSTSPDTWQRCRYTIGFCFLHISTGTETESCCMSPIKYIVLKNWHKQWAVWSTTCEGEVCCQREMLSKEDILQ